MDYSGQSDLLTCPRKYEHHWLDRLTDPSPSIALQFGGAWHKILETYGLIKMGEMSDDGVFQPDDLVNGVLKSEGWEDPTDYRTAEKLRQGFRGWVEHWMDQPLQYVVTEQSYRAELIPDMEPQTGIIDAIAWVMVDPSRGKELFVVDYKTTSRLESDWVTLYRNSNQFKYYYLAMKARYPELAGVLVDVYHATKGVQRTKDPGNKFYRIVIRYEGDTLQEAVWDYGHTVEQRNGLAAGEHPFFPKNTSACHAYNHTCAFIDLCDAKSEDERNRLKSGFAPNLHAIKMEELNGYDYNGGRKPTLVIEDGGAAAVQKNPPDGRQRDG